MVGCVGVFIAGLVLALLITPAVRRLAVRLEIYDLPAGPLKTHGRPVPYLGGIAIFAAVALALVVGAIGRRFSFWSEGPSPGLARTVAAAGLLITVAGLIDDLRPMLSWQKLACQLAAGSLAVAVGVRLTIVVLPEWLNAILSVFWIVAIANAFNIIDVMDGAAAGVACISCFAFAASALAAGEGSVAIVALALAGACLGFLKYNFHPARIFMGDAGSGFLGLAIAVISMAVSYTGRNSLALVAPVMILGIPIYDTALVALLRLRKGRAVFRGSRDHLALRLLALGFSKRAVAICVYLVSAWLGAVALLLVRVRLEWAIVICAVVLTAALWAGRKLSRVEMEPVGHGDRR